MGPQKGGVIMKDEKKEATIAQAEKILSLFKGLDREKLQRLLESGLLTDLIRGNFGSIVSGENRKEFQKSLYIIHLIIKERIVVNYDSGIFHNLGRNKYASLADFSTDNINDEAFPTTGKGVATVNAGIFHFGYPIEREEAILRMAEYGYRPAEPIELVCSEYINSYPFLFSLSPLHEIRGLVYTFCKVGLERYAKVETGYVKLFIEEAYFLGIEK